MMRFFKRAAVAALSTMLFACNSDNDNNTEFELESPRTVDFASGELGYSVMFSDYPKNEEEFYELGGEYSALPEGFSDKKGWKLVGNNHSDDLFMAIKGKVGNLESNTLYKVSISADILTNAQSNCMGIGGAPGESVYVKLGTSTEEPVNELQDDLYRLSVDIGNQSSAGTQGMTVGNIANGDECGQDEVFKTKTLSMEGTIDVTSDDDGMIWIIAGTDSGFEGKTTVYFTKLTVSISE